MSTSVGAVHHLQSETRRAHDGERATRIDDQSGAFAAHSTRAYTTITRSVSSSDILTNDDRSGDYVTVLPGSAGERVAAARPAVAMRRLRGARPAGHVPASLCPKNHLAHAARGGRRSSRFCDDRNRRRSRTWLGHRSARALRIASTAAVARPMAPSWRWAQRWAPLRLRAADRAAPTSLPSQLAAR